MRGQSMIRIRRAVAALVVGALAVAAPALAQTPAPAPAPPADAKPNTGRVSLSAGADWTTDYYFRGILQEDRDWIVQPYGDITFKLMEGTPAFGNLGLTVGLWNSLHGGPTGIDGNRTDPDLWYESDFYTKVGWTFLEDFSSAIIYTAYMSPNDSFRTVQELAFSLGYNDSKLLGPFALNPSVLVAFEVKGQADAGRHRGVYLQAGIAPGYTFNAKGTYPVTLTVPLLVGMSLSEYYEFGTGNDDTFGFFQGGVAVAVPLAFIPPSFGSWTIKGSLNVLQLGDNLKAVNNNDRTEIIGTIGLAFAY
ncbi:MAG TPA: hypothetical protein VFO31_13370 [Vicinamibacterales bacterium]|nr:hypothetical protein [Vicinamibacterales bacterium]